MRGSVRTMEYEVRTVPDKWAPQGVVEIYTMNAGTITDGSESIAFFAVHQYVDVYVDDKLVYSLKKSDECELGQTAGTNWINVALEHDQSNKDIEVRLTPIYKSSIGTHMEFLAGPQIDLVLKQLRADWILMALSILTMASGFIFFAIAIFTFRKKATGDNLASLGCFAIMIGLWKFTDIGLCFIMWPEKTILFFYISIGMLMFMPVPIMKAMKSFYDERLHKIMDISCNCGYGADCAADV